jgi:hypothetical protein
MSTRRQFLTRAALGTLGVTGGALGLPALVEGPAEEALPDGAASRGMITPKTEQAIERGLLYLASNKGREGSFGTNFYQGNTAVTSLAALAFMAAGYMPNRGQHGRVVTDALRFILQQEARGGQAGYLHNPSATPHGPMYGHGFATLFLAEVSGQVHDKQLRDQVNGTLHRAVKLILDSQNIEGGWRYTPGSREADLSVTVCQIMALRAARNAGIDVPKSKVDKCVEYVKGCQDKGQGWFRYMRNGGGGGGAQGFARTAAGVAALNSAGIYKGAEVAAGVRFLRSQKPGNGARGGDFLSRPDMHYFYGHYYAVQVMWTAGGEVWDEWFPAIREELLAAQRRDSSWQDQICAHYATAMALLILQVPNNYLTIFQK